MRSMIDTCLSWINVVSYDDDNDNGDDDDDDHANVVAAKYVLATM